MEGTDTTAAREGRDPLLNADGHTPYRRPLAFSDEYQPASGNRTDETETDTAHKEAA